MAAARWGAADDAKLATLWRTPHNRIDSTKLDKDSVKAVHSAHFNHTKYANFAPLYHGKARAFNVSNTLDGHRKRSAFHKAAEEGRINLDDISDDDSDPYEAEEVTSEEDDGGEEQNSEEEEVIDDDEDSMPRATTLRCTPPPKKKKASGNTPVTRRPSASSSSAGAETEDALSARMEELSMAVPTFSMEFKQPFILTQYNEGTDQMITIHVVTLTMPKDSFIPEVAENGKRLEIRIQVPPFLVNEGLIIEAKAGVKGFNKNTHQAQAFKDVCETIDTHYGMLASIFGHPMSIALPFVCEERVVEWEIQAHSNNMGELTDDLGGQQFFACLSITLRKLKTKRKTTGVFRVIGEVPGRMQEEE